MNDIITAANKTPIEIALQVDEHGMTTAKNLYAFLGLRPKNYSVWCKRNILGDANANENVDFIPFLLKEERNPNPTTDYKITASFAKKLAMQTKNGRGEQARDYFIKIEEKLKEVAIQHQTEKTTALSNFNNITFMKAVVAELEAQKQDIVSLNERVSKIEYMKPVDVVSVVAPSTERTPYTRNNVYSSTTIAKAFGMGGKTLNEILAAEGIIKRVHVYYPNRGKVCPCWIITERFRNLKYSAQKYAGVRNSGSASPVEVTYAWTPKGVAFIVNLLKYRGYVQQGDINNRIKTRIHKKAAQ